VSRKIYCIIYRGASIPENELIYSLGTQVDVGAIEKYDTP